MVNKCLLDGKLKETLPKLNKRDITVLSIFIVVLLLWILPSLFENVAPTFYEFFNKYGSNSSSLSTLYFIFPPTNLIISFF